MRNRDYTKYMNRRTKPENIVENVAEPVEVVSTAPTIGVVVDCHKLNVRAEPNIEADIICELTCSAEVTICMDESADDFYKVCTAVGLEGFCMKKFIEIRG